MTNKPTSPPPPPPLPPSPPPPPPQPVRKRDAPVPQREEHGYVRHDSNEVRDTVRPPPPPTRR